MQLSALCRGGVTVRCEQRMRPPTQAVLFRRENGLSHGLNKVKGTSQPGWLPSPQVPLLHRTKDRPCPRPPQPSPSSPPSPTPTDVRLSPPTIDECSSTKLRARFRFSAFVSGRRSRQWRPASAPPTTGRSLWPLTVPVRRSPTTRPPIGSSPMSHRTGSRTPHTRARHSALPTPGVGTRKPRLARLRSRRHARRAARRATPLARAAPPASPGRSGATVESGTARSSHTAPADDVGGASCRFNRGHEHLDRDSSGAGLVVRRGVVRSSLLCVTARSRHRRG